MAIAAATLIIAAAIYKQDINLETGQYLDNPKNKFPIYCVRVVEEAV